MVLTLRFFDRELWHDGAPQSGSTWHCFLVCSSSDWRMRGLHGRRVKSRASDRLKGREVQLEKVDQFLRRRTLELRGQQSLLWISGRTTIQAEIASPISRFEMPKMCRVQLFSHVAVPASLQRKRRPIRHMYNSVSKSVESDRNLNICAPDIAILFE